MKSFTIPTFYKSSVIGQIKETRRKQDRLKKDFGELKMLLDESQKNLFDVGYLSCRWTARHFW